MSMYNSNEVCLMTGVHDSHKHIVKALIFVVALITLLSFGYLVQAEEARGTDAVLPADTMNTTSTTLVASDAERWDEEGINDDVESIPTPSFEQVGVASWYGNKFHGRRTASGERYNMHAYTAAHKNLPFGTILRVTNLDNDKSVLVRINDRGPYIRGRIIDLSRAAAQEIGVTLHKVKIEEFKADATSGEPYALGFDSAMMPVAVPSEALSTLLATENFTEAMQAWLSNTSNGQKSYLVLHPIAENGTAVAKRKKTRAASYHYSIGVESESTLASNR